MTIFQAYQSGHEQLRKEGHFSQNEAKSTARIGLDYLMGARYIHLTEPQRELTAEEEIQWNAMLAELAAGRPLSYMMGKREFLGLTFHCDQRALIPRPETEIVVEKAVERLSEYSRPVVADLGTGAGSIAIGVAHLLPQAQVWATDASTDALELAAENAQNLGVSDRVQFVEGAIGEWSEPLLKQNLAGRCDAILSNPPYVTQPQLKELAPQIREWEPHIALDGGADGLNNYRHIAAQCGALLAPNGFLMVELGAAQYESARDIFTEAGWTVEEAICDLAGIERVLAARLQ